jgi:hypothetical protein
MRKDIDIVATAMSEAWDQVRLRERLAAMAANESEVFETLAAQLEVPLDELRSRAKRRCIRERERGA